MCVCACVSTILMTRLTYAGFGTLRRRKKDEDKEAEKAPGSPEESGDEDIAGTIIGNEEIVLR